MLRFHPYFRLAALTALLTAMLFILVSVVARAAAPEFLLAEAVRSACIDGPPPQAHCAPERNAEIRAMAEQLYVVGEDILACQAVPEACAEWIPMQHRRHIAESSAKLPAWLSWWVVAQASRESGFRSEPCLGGGAPGCGDRGKSHGPLQLQDHFVKSWAQWYDGAILDRLDPTSAARALLLKVAWSFSRQIERHCGKGFSVHHRFRLAAARVGRGPVKLSRLQRCDFWINSRKGRVQTAGITVVWGSQWFDNDG